jgi:hypothetical protein
MKTLLVTTAICATLLLGVSERTLWAAEVGRMTVPFPFVVNGRTLPPGRYDVRSDDRDPTLVRIDGVTNTKAHAILVTIPDYGRSPSGDKPAMTFMRTEGQYRLSRVWESRDYDRDIVLP